MASSLRRRILAVAVIAFVGCVASILGVIQYARTTTQQRILRSEDSVSAEVERLALIAEENPAPETRARGRRGFGVVKSGFLNDDFEDAAAVAPIGAPAIAARKEMARQAKETGKLVVRESAMPDGASLVLAVEPVVHGGFAWAASIQRQQVEQERLRARILFLALGGLVLIAVSVHTLIVFQRGAASLGKSLRALGRDLSAPVARPELAELGEIADGIGRLSVDLAEAQKEQGRLVRELAERERLAALGRIVAGVAHEVRNPLAAIKLRADLALENPALDPQLAHDLTDIAGEVTRLNRFVQDLLVVSGRQPASRKQANLATLARQRAELLEPWARERTVRIEVAGEADAPIEAGAIARAIDNLLRNAVEASPPEATVTVRVGRSDAEATIAVIDRGPGIDADHQSKLFEPFFTTKPDGTGLGLALSLSVAEAHGGALLYARAGERTTFTLTIRG